MSEHEQQSPVQGMYCQVNDTGTQRCTVTMSDVCLTVYREVNLMTFDAHTLSLRFNAIVQKAGGVVNRQRYIEDMTDLLILCEKVQQAKMSLRSGDKIITYALDSNIVQDDETGILHLSPQRPEWWSHPKLEPIIQSMQSYLPDFKPWLLQKDIYFGILSGKSSLL